jgi:protein involved in polysaccharide export with SLBB domain
MERPISMNVHIRPLTQHSGRRVLLLASVCLISLALDGHSQNANPSSDGPASVAGALSTVALTTSMEVLNDSVKLGIGDRVSLRIIEERRVPISLFVTDSGEMEVPLIGRVVAKGKTCKQLAYELKPILEREYFYKATVIIGVDNISVRSRGRVYITGQVRQEGGLEIPPDEPLTVSKAVLRVGGLSDFANRRKVKLIRKKPDGTSETRIIDLGEILDKGRLEKDVVLEPGDLINVPERLF